MVNRKKVKTIHHSPFSIHFPLVALIVSGGHTDLILMTNHGKYQWLGGTLDDAAGEAFDKVARILGLGYPGGPQIEQAASQGSGVRGQGSIVLPRPMIKSADYDFSFSGLKTAVVNTVHSSQPLVPKGLRPEGLTVHGKKEIAYEFQEAIVDVLIAKTLRAAKNFSAKTIVVGGGVAANQFLRSRFTVHGSLLGIPVFFPSKEFSVDNGAMIAAAAFFTGAIINPIKIQSTPNLHL